MPDNHKPEPPELLSFREFAGLTTLTKSFEQSSKFVREQQARISSMLKSLSVEFAKSYPQMEAAADRLADMGWTFPMLVTPKTIVALADPAYVDSDIEVMLSDFYSDFNFEQLRIVQPELLKAPLLSRYAGLLNEAFDSLYEGRFQVPVPALLAITEGIIADGSGNLNEGLVKVRKMATDLESNQQRQSFDSLQWRSVRRWIDHLFGNAPFSGSQPPRINRHWILHGRDAGPWTRTDVVRLLAGLHTLVS